MTENKSKLITLEEKKLFADLIISKQGSHRSVANLYQISKSAVGRYSRNVKNGLPPSKGCGRPSYLDEISKNILKSFAGKHRSNEFQEELSQLIKSEYLNTHKRRQICGNDSLESVEISIRTFSRHFKIYNDFKT